MSCTNCFDNCLKGITLDTCVRYTGAGDETLGINTGDSLYSVLNTLITSINDITSPTYSSACAFLTSLIGSSSNISQEAMINGLQAAVCALKTSVDDLAPGSYSFDTSCLTVGASPTRDDILQAAIAKICAMNTTLTTVSSDYVKASQLCTLVNQCIAGSASTQEYTKMPKYVALPYHGPTTVFDANGTGLSTAGYDKVYMCLGQTVNGFTLPDYRGRSPMGANSGVPTSGMDSTVNPALTPNAGYALTNKQKLGSFNHTLTTSQIPSHTHTVTDPGHDHSMGGAFTDKGDDNNYSLLSNGGNQKTLKSTTGITIASTGGGQAHNTVHPVVGAVMIMYVP